ncbi:GDSL esterase/lipase [Canna indica]|uniref:GDSL esterase/lipase n=1 Tax=Canna indica TaxID=4628 RepID=A0AAQ3L0Q6_9LILI|nr:GDSL esterase/lipase [Canna indica]
MASETATRNLALLQARAAFVVLLILYLPSAANSKCILFNFGDSNSDTGGMMAGLGFYLNPPAGRLFFHRSTGRFCDGRLYIDFICERLKMSLLSHYLESSGSDFTHGVNFAVAGAAAELTITPFPLSTQVLQFLHFKNRTRELRPRGTSSILSWSMITEEEFTEAIYSIDIGQNDVSYPLSLNMTTADVIQNIPTILSKIRAAILLHQNGARKFWIYNTGPFGCLPQKLALQKKNDSRLDQQGCLADFNNVAQVFNAGLGELCDQLRSEFKNDATIVYTDMYAIKYDLVANHAKYGFDYPLMACCGYGGPPYNYRYRMTCGEPNITACADGSRYISWDGVHNTEAANHIIASKVLSAKYSRPQIKLKDLCRG